MNGDIYMNNFSIINANLINVTLINLSVINVTEILGFNESVNATIYQDYVTYEGAVKNVDLGDKNLTADYIIGNGSYLTSINCSAIVGGNDSNFCDDGGGVGGDTNTNWIINNTALTNESGILGINNTYLNTFKGDIDGGVPSSIYLPTQVYDGGAP